MLVSVKPCLAFLLRSPDLQQGASRAAPGKSGLHARGEGERVLALESREPLSGLKGVQPPLPFGERSRDCSPGHAGKEGPQLARTGGQKEKIC